MVVLIGQKVELLSKLIIIAHHQVEDPSSSTFSDLVSQCRETFLRKVFKLLN